MGNSIQYAQLNSLNVIPIFNLPTRELHKLDNNNNLVVAQLQLAVEYDITFPIHDENIISEYTISGNGVLTKDILEKITDDLRDDGFMIKDLVQGTYSKISALQLFWARSIAIPEDKRPFNWQELNRACLGVGKRGCTPTWFKLLQQFWIAHFEDSILADESHLDVRKTMIPGSMN